jgi:hypothetical protein
MDLAEADRDPRRRIGWMKMNTDMVMQPEEVARESTGRGRFLGAVAVLTFCLLKSVEACLISIQLIRSDATQVGESGVKTRREHLIMLEKRFLQCDGLVLMIDLKLNPLARSGLCTCS